MIEKAAAVLAGGIDHSTGKAALRHQSDERVVWSLIGKCDSIRLTRRVSARTQSSCAECAYKLSWT
jgi:hypothetical protein